MYHPFLFPASAAFFAPAGSEPGRHACFRIFDFVLQYSITFHAVNGFSFVITAKNGRTMLQFDSRTNAYGKRNRQLPPSVSLISFIKIL